MGGLCAAAEHVDACGIQLFASIRYNGLRFKDF